MKLPTEDFNIKIGYLTYLVTYKESRQENVQVFGSHDDRTQTIYINPKYSKEQQEATFIHELLHAIIAMSGLSTRFDYEKLELRPSHEEIVTEITPFLILFIKDNPKLFV